MDLKKLKDVSKTTMIPIVGIIIIVLQRLLGWLQDSPVDEAMNFELIIVIIVQALSGYFAEDKKDDDGSDVTEGK